MNFISRFLVTPARLAAGVILLALLTGPSPVAAQSTSFPVYLPAIQKMCVPQLVDDFSDPNSGWPVYEDADVKTGYVNGEYNILIKTVDQNTHGRSMGVRKAGLQAENFSVQVDVRNPNWFGKEGMYGILFGISSDFSELYSFTIDPSGIYSLDRYNKNAANQWANLAYNRSAAILVNDATNHLRVDREGETIRLYANGTLIETITDATFTGPRYVGLEADAFNVPGLEAHFDNFTVYASTCMP